MARDLVQVAVAPQKAAEAANVLVSEDRMLTMPIVLIGSIVSRALRQEH